MSVGACACGGVCVGVCVWREMGKLDLHTFNTHVRVQCSLVMLRTSVFSMFFFAASLNLSASRLSALTRPTSSTYLSCSTKGTHL